MESPANARTSAVGFDPTRLIREHQAGVWRYLRALGCDASEASDLTQETFLNVLQRPFVEYSPVATSAYLRKVAHNLFISARRRSGRFESVANLETLDADWNRWAGDDQGESLLEALRECLKQLTQRARLALDLRFQKKESRAQIAAALQVTEHGAKNLMQRAKQQLRACIEDKLK